MRMLQTVSGALRNIEIKKNSLRVSRGSQLLTAEGQ